MKKCSKCKTEKPLEEFHKRKASKDGYRHDCKECSKVTLKTWRKANPERDRERKRKWASENQEKLRESSRKWASENRDKVRESARKWRKAHLEERREYNRKWISENRERAREYCRKWASENPDKARAKDAKRRALKRDAMTGDPAKIEAYYTFCRWATWATGVVHHVDHIIPLSKGGEHHEDNLTVIPAEVNMRKSDALDFDTEAAVREFWGIGSVS